MATTLTQHYKRRQFLIALGQVMMVIGFIVHCNSMWITLAPHDNLIKNIAMMFVCLGAVVAILASGALFKTKKMVLSVAFTGVLAIYLMLFLFVTDYAHKIFIKNVTVVLIMLLYILLVEEADEIPKVLLKYERIITVVAAVSLICWLVFSVLQLIPPSADEMTWWNGTDHYTEVTSYYNIYYEPQWKKLFGVWIARNCSIFTEAPMASLHFCFGFLINLFLREKTSKIRLGIMIAAIATTMSITGYIVVVIALVMKLFMKIFSSTKYAQMPKSSKTAMKVFLVIILVALAAVCYYLVSQRIGGQSWRIREEDFKAAFQAWFDSPVFGHGNYNFDAVKVHFRPSRAANPGYSSTTALGTILADGGIAFGVLYVGSFICLLIKAAKNYEYNVMFFAILVFLMFIVTIVPYDFIMIFMFIFFATYKSKVRKYFERKMA